MTARKKTTDPVVDTPDVDAVTPEAKGETPAPETVTPEVDTVTAEASAQLADDVAAGLEQAHAEEDAGDVVAVLESFPPDVAFSRSLLELLDSESIDPALVTGINLRPGPQSLGVEVAFLDHNGTRVGKVIRTPRLDDVAGERDDEPIDFELVDATPAGRPIRDTPQA